MVAIYTRQSVDRTDSISVELQAETCRMKLTANELETCETYTDKGFSGKNTNRPALQRLMEDVAAGRVEKILVYKIDRISRSVHGAVPEAVRKGRRISVRNRWDHP